MDNAEQCGSTSHAILPTDLAAKDLELAHHLPGPEVGRPFTSEEVEELARMVDGWFTQQTLLEKVAYLKLLGTGQAAKKLMLLAPEERNQLLDLLSPSRRGDIFAHWDDADRKALSA